MVVSPCVGEGIKLGHIIDKYRLDRALSSIVVLAAILMIEDSNLATLVI